MKFKPTVNYWSYQRYIIMALYFLRGPKIVEKKPYSAIQAVISWYWPLLFLRPSPWKIKLEIQDSQHQHIMTINGPCCPCGCSDIEFPVSPSNINWRHLFIYTAIVKRNTNAEFTKGISVYMVSTTVTEVVI